MRPQVFLPIYLEARSETEYDVSSLRRLVGAAPVDWPLEVSLLAKVHDGVGQRGAAHVATPQGDVSARGKDSVNFANFRALWHIF